MKSNYINNEKGITLPELLAVFVILAILGVIIIAILLNGFNYQTNVQIEAELRDEADIIMAQLLNDLYTLKDSEIAAEHFPASGSNDYYFELTDGSTIGFIGGTVYLRSGETVALTSNEIQLTNQTKIEEDEDIAGLYHITLALEKVGDGIKPRITTESEIRIIMDLD